MLQPQSVKEKGRARVLNDGTDFDGFFKRRYPLLVAHLVKLGFSGDEAQESAEEAMVAVLERWSEITNPAAYAYKAALNHCVRERNRRMRSHEDAAERADPANGYALKDAEISYLKALQCLPFRQRAVMVLDWADFDTETIAKILDTTAETVRSNRRHARQALRQRSELETPTVRKGV